MRMPLLLLAALFVSAGLIRGEIKTPENAPIEITSTGETTYENGLATANDTAKPDFHLHARKIRIYEKDRVILQYVTAYVGNVPVFWWPYLYESLSDTFSFTVSPAYLSSWGPSLLTQVMFPITDYVKARVRLDYFGRRGAAIGFDPVIDFGKDETSQARIKTFYIDDQNPDINQTSEVRQN